MTIKVGDRVTFYPRGITEVETNVGGIITALSQGVEPGVLFASLLCDDNTMPTNVFVRQDDTEPPPGYYCEVWVDVHETAGDLAESEDAETEEVTTIYWTEGDTPTGEIFKGSDFSGVLRKADWLRGEGIDFIVHVTRR